MKVRCVNNELMGDFLTVEREYEGELDILEPEFIILKLDDKMRTDFSYRFDRFEIIRNNNNELNFIEAINKAKDGDLFKIVSEPFDEFNEVIELEVKYLHGDLFILKSSDSLDDIIDNSLSTIYTLEAISKMKFFIR